MHGAKRGNTSPRKPGISWVKVIELIQARQDKPLQLLVRNAAARLSKATIAVYEFNVSLVRQQRS